VRQEGGGGNKVPKGFGRYKLPGKVGESSRKICPWKKKTMKEGRQTQLFYCKKACLDRTKLVSFQVMVKGGEKQD